MSAAGKISEAGAAGQSARLQRVIRDLGKALFGTPLNAAITLACCWLVWRLARASFGWLVVDAVFAGGRQQCTLGAGACWPFLVAKLRFMLLGTYPYDQQWRVALSLAIFCAIVGVSMFPRLWSRRLIAAWLAAIVALAVLMAGGVFGLSYVPMTQWSGLPLSVMLAFVGLALGFPTGVLLALGRTGQLPAIRALATLFIEIVRSLPLVTVLFMAVIMLPLFTRSTVAMGVLFRVQIAIILFAGAYIAETVRGGLQAIPREQYEAAHCLGLRYWQMMRLIIVPQALKICIPSLLIVVIGFFQDTALVTIVGLFDFLSTVRAAMHDPNWEGVVVIDGYLFAAAIYFAISFGIGVYGRFIERQTAVA